MVAPHGLHGRWSSACRSLIAVVLRALSALGASPVSVNNSAVTGPVIFGLMIWGFFVRFSVPVLGVFYGTVAHRR